MIAGLRVSLRSVLVAAALGCFQTMAVHPAFAATPARMPSALVPVDMAGSANSRAADVEELEAPRVGEYAPDFELPTMDGSTVMRLSAHRGARPVLLVFGSYT